MNMTLGIVGISEMQKCRVCNLHLLNIIGRAIADPAYNVR
jgi:hypothetical protein